jgi:hypothetical protein
VNLPSLLAGPDPQNGQGRSSGVFSLLTESPFVSGMSGFQKPANPLKSINRHMT